VEYCTSVVALACVCFDKTLRRALHTHKHTHTHTPRTAHQVSGMHPEDVATVLRSTKDSTITLFFNRNSYDPSNRAYDIKYAVDLTQVTHPSLIPPTQEVGEEAAAEASDEEEEVQEDGGMEREQVTGGQTAGGEGGRREVGGEKRRLESAEKRVEHKGRSEEEHGGELVMGTMMKRGEKHTAWQSRFFVLSRADSIVRYYADEKVAAPLCLCVGGGRQEACALLFMRIHMRMGSCTSTIACACARYNSRLQLAQVDLCCTLELKQGPSSYCSPLHVRK
jgi:hypothetical protein